MTAFTYDACREFLDRFRRGGDAFGEYADAPSDRTDVLRHDVDWSPDRAPLPDRVGVVRHDRVWPEEDVVADGRSLREGRPRLEADARTDGQVDC